MNTDQVEELSEKEDLVKAEADVKYNVLDLSKIESINDVSLVFKFLQESGFFIIPFKEGECPKELIHMLGDCPDELAQQFKEFDNNQVNVLEETTEGASQ